MNAFTRSPNTSIAAGRAQPRAKAAKIAVIMKKQSIGVAKLNYRERQREI